MANSSGKNDHEGARKLQWRRWRCRRQSKGKVARERARPSARERGENGECAEAMEGGGEVMAPVGARMPSTRRHGRDAVGRARRGHCGERKEGEGAGVGEAGLASLDGPVGWRRPASEQTPFPFF